MLASADIISSRRSAQIARIEALRRETSVSRFEQRLIEPAAWAWLGLTFVASSVALAIAGVVGEYLPSEIAIVLTGIALFLGVTLVDSLFTVAPSAELPVRQEITPARPSAARRAMGRTLSWAIRTALILLVLGGAALVAVLRFASEVPALDRVVEILGRQRDAIEQSMRADSLGRSVAGRTSGRNWRLIAHDGRYVAAPLADAKRHCASLGNGWALATNEDFTRLAPVPDDPTSLHVWVSRGADRDERTASSAQIVAGSWQPTGFLSSKDTGRDLFQVLCVRSGS